MDDRTVRVALQRHWDASDASDFKVEHEIYHEDAVLDYPQSGERIRGRHNIQESRFVQPNKKRFTARELLAAASSGSLNLYLHMTASVRAAGDADSFRGGRVCGLFADEV